MVRLWAGDTQMGRQPEILHIRRIISTLRQQISGLEVPRVLLQSQGSANKNSFLILTFETSTVMVTASPCTMYQGFSPIF